MTTRKVTACFTELSRVCLIGGRRFSCVALVSTSRDPLPTSPISTLTPVCKATFARVCQTQVRAFLRDVRCKLQAVSCTRNRIAAPLNSARCGWFTLQCTVLSACSLTYRSHLHIGMRCVQLPMSTITAFRTWRRSSLSLLKFSGPTTLMTFLFISSFSEFFWRSAIRCIARKTSCPRSTSKGFSNKARTTAM